MNGRSFARFVTAVVAALATLPALAAGGASVAEVVFDSRPFAAVTSPQTLVYRYRLHAGTMAEDYVAEARMEIREVRPDGSKLVWFDMFDGPNHRNFGPVPASDQNPMVLVFLQRDVTAMANLTGGAAGYFQQQIRRAFTSPGTVEQLTVRWNGREYEARRVVLQPFANDPQVERFPKFRGKTYEFVMAPGIPGGIWQLSTRVPGPDGAPFIEETWTFEAARP